MAIYRSNASSHDARIEAALFDIDLFNIFFEKIQPSVLHISMITVGVMTSVPLPLMQLNDSFVESFKTDARFEFKSLSGCCGVPPSRFNSSHELKINYNGGGKYILIFKNSFQITGCKRVDEAATIVGAIFKHLSIPIDISVTDCETRMFNTNFSIGKGLLMSDLHQRLVAKYPYVTFNPDLPLKGIKIPFTDQGQSVSIIIYAKGKIVMTGAKDIDLVVKAYKSITEFLEAHPEVMVELQAELPKVPKKPGRKRKSDEAQLYNDLLEKLES